MEVGLSRNDEIGWGAHATPRAVLRALAEHIGVLLWPKRLVSRMIGNQQAGAPVETREGACAPRNRTESFRKPTAAWLILSAHPYLSSTHNKSPFAFLKYNRPFANVGGVQQTPPRTWERPKILSSVGNGSANRSSPFSLIIISLLPAHITEPNAGSSRCHFNSPVDKWMQRKS